MLVAEPTALLAPAQRAPQSDRPRHRSRLGPGWPLALCLVLYPVWWALGLGSFAFILAAIPMAAYLFRHRPVQLPPAFGFWLLFLLWNVLSLVMLPAHAPHTAEGSASGRAISVAVRFVDLGTATVFLLYVTNLPRSLVSSARIAKWLGGLFLVTVGGGLLALAAPHFEFSSPFELVLPHGITSNTYVHTLVHPAAAQNQEVLGFSSPRPSAPWAYTNAWGNSLSLLLIWFCVFMWVPKLPRRHLKLAAVLAVALVPVIYSLNRGLWLGLVLSIVFVVLHLARRGHLRGTVIAVGAVLVGAVLFVATPLNTVVQQRASHGTSNDIRAFVDSSSFQGALESPVVGWGDSRKVLGSAQSIAVGPSPKCPLCGQVNLGSAGEIWEIMFDQGLLGAAIYVAFFVGVWWRLRRVRNLYGVGARLATILTVFYTIFYNNLPTSLILSMISIALGCRELVQREQPVTAAPAR